MNSIDRSNGYEVIASRFIETRAMRSVGVALVRDWSRSLPAGASVLDLGCGCGVPVSAALLERGHSVYGIDASATMVAEFRRGFPSAAIECAPVEDSSFFDMRFDAAIAWGLLFLLDERTQLAVIGKVAAALKADGRFLFTAPAQRSVWPDAMTGLRSVSLGRESYKNALESAGMTLVRECEDEGGNHYYFANKSG